MDYGFAQAGFKTIWANELSADAAKSYSTLIGHEPIVNDIWNVLNDIPSADIVIGGPPCQSFSLAGKRLQDDPRGQLVFAFQQVIERIKPLAFVMENVPGLMASQIDGKKLHLHLAENFKSLGYKVSILKLTATDYFVPQKRQRVIMIGHRMPEKDFEMISPESFAKILGDDALKIPISSFDALGDLPSPLSKDQTVKLEYKLEPHSPYTKIMRKYNPGTITLQSNPTMSILDKEFVKHIPPGGNYTNIPDEISTTRIMSFKKTGGRTTTYGRLHPEKPAYTINTYFNRPNVGANYHYEDERLITVREALRLQSFPDHFTPYYSNQRSLHMQVGNAVPPLLARAIAESLHKILS